MKYRLLHLILLFTIILITVQSGLGQGEVDELSRAVRHSIERTIAEGPLQVVESYSVTDSDLSYKAHSVKVLDTATERIYTYWYDAELQPISEEEAFQQRVSAYETHYGRLSKGLYERISLAESGTIIPVAIWAEQSSAPPLLGNAHIYLPFATGGSGTVSFSCTGSMDCIVQYLRNNGIEPDYVSSETPTVFADVPTSLINQLQLHSYVAAIYEQQEVVPTLASAARTSAAPWIWERGITGEGIKVAVLEEGGVDFDNPYINGSKYYVGWWKRVGDHATGVAGMIASTHDTNRGIAPGVEILSANAPGYIEHLIVAAADWTVESGANIINASFGVPCRDNSISSLDKYMDWLVWEEKVTVTVAAGNLRNECPSNYNVMSPGKAYNVITVGSKDDQNTADSEEDIQDDQFSYFSLYVDPETTSSNRLKPEVVAVGENIVTTYSVGEPWFNSESVQGTSFAAPIVAGQAALMMDRASWLKEAPEAVKAGVMATARWTRLRDDVNPDEWASVDKMGVGAIDTTAADNSLINDRIQALYLHEGDFSNGHYDLHFDGLAGQRIRVIIVWNSHPGKRIVNWILHDRLESDFDLTVRAPNGQIFGSYADEANYEIVEFVAPQTGSYRARIHLSRWDDSTMEERVGFAWYSGLPLP